jgi:O-methyltransferase
MMMTQPEKASESVKVSGYISAKTFEILRDYQAEQDLESTLHAVTSLLTSSLLEYQRRKESPYTRNLLYETDKVFNQFYEEGMLVSQTPDSGSVRRERFYNLISFLRQVIALDGKVIECGCWKGLSSYLMCHYLQQSQDKTFQGQDYWIVDSFEGLSAPTPQDRINKPLIREGILRTGQVFKDKGAYAASLEHVQSTLEKFPEISYFKGFIPNVLQELPETTYRFVHIDVDIYEPTLAAAQYFYPRLVKGGILICDDYGSLFWPGAKKAIDEFCAAQQIFPLTLSTGQAVIFKKS